MTTTHENSCLCSSDGSRLKNQIWTTKQARYIASRRLSKQNYLYLCSISFLSFYVLALSILQILPVDIFNETQGLFVSYFIIVISMFILVISLIENSNNRMVRAERLHRCANEMTKLYDELCYICEEKECNGGIEAIKNINRKYHDIIDKYLENHEELDYKYGLATNSWVAWTILKKISIRYSWFVNIYTAPLVMILFPPIMIMFILLLG